MSIEIKIPSVGESVTEVTIAAWMKRNGEFVDIDEPVCEIESDKASMELPSPEAGILTITMEEGDTVDVGSVIGTIVPGSKPAAAESVKTETKSETSTNSSTEHNQNSSMGHVASPAAKKIMAEKGIDASSVTGTGKDGRITKSDASNAIDRPATSPSIPKLASIDTTQISTLDQSRDARGVERKRMSGLRKTIAKKLVSAQQTTAMLTTFNEVDMKAVMDLRKKYKESFKEKHEIGLGFMSFFTKAACMALKDFPSVNAQIEGQEMVFHNYCDIGIAVSTPKGLVVPVVRNAEHMGLASIEKSIRSLALKARDGKLSINEMQGGTFTITNGGVFGSMLSTPIINTPQSAILGMHNIVERPVAINGEVHVRPVMYLALSYDHRIIDGKESVSFLKRIKELLEDPARLLLDI